MIEVQQQQAGQGMRPAVGVDARAAEIANGFLAVAHREEGVGDTGFDESSLHEEYLIRVIFCQQNGPTFVHNAHHSGWSKGQYLLRQSKCKGAKKDFPAIQTVDSANRGYWGGGSKGKIQM